MVTKYKHGIGYNCKNIKNPIAGLGGSLKKIVLTGGGTAGHVTPNIALIPELKKRGFESWFIPNIYTEMLISGLWDGQSIVLTTPAASCFILLFSVMAP